MHHWKETITHRSVAQWLVVQRQERKENPFKTHQTQDVFLQHLHWDNEGRFGPPLHGLFFFVFGSHNFSTVTFFFLMFSTPIKKNKVSVSTLATMKLITTGLLKKNLCRRQKFNLHSLLGLKCVWQGKVGITYWRNHV